VPFFDVPPCRPPEPPPPPWAGPPNGVFGELAPVRAVLVRTDALVVVADHFVCYPSGFELRLAVRLRPDGTGGSHPGRLFMGPLGWPPLGEAADNGLRFGIAYADGRNATNLRALPHLGGREQGDPASSDFVTVTETRPAGGMQEEPVPPLLLPRGGSGGGDRWDQDYWVWGLPPSGPVGLVVEWPAEDIVETRVDVDGDAIVGAAAGAEVLWED
jgi:hypothetical protein